MAEDKEQTYVFPEDRYPIVVRWEFHEHKSGDLVMPAETIFEHEAAIAILLVHEVLFVNAPWYRNDLAPADRERALIHVNCSDVFMWGSADAEELPYHEIENLYQMWEKDPDWGPAVWCMIQRKMMPQKPVADRIKAQGIWELESLGLAKNQSR